jgi:protoheme IX farnesyltransferase
MAARGQVQPGVFLAMLAGLSLIMASSCIFNNYLDRGIDAKMQRTKYRSLASGTIQARTALIFATVLAVVGALILGFFTTPLALCIALIGMFAYVVVYGIAKRRSVHGTVVGSISGAVPPVVGYVAVTGRMDLGAWLLFLILVLWQMPHFYAIAIFRRDDYAAAHIPVLPIVSGIAKTKLQMFSYIIAFILATSLLTVFHYTGYVYLAVMLIVGLAWLRRSMRGFHAKDNVLWARRLFRFSLLVLLAWSVMISIGPLLP